MRLRHLDRTKPAGPPALGTDPNTPVPVDIWVMSLDRPVVPLEQLWTVLCHREQSRAERFSRQQLTNRFVAARGQMRLILSGATGIAAQDIAYRIGDHGKPALEIGPDQPRLAFNLSGSQGTGMLALCTAGELGVDIEAIRPFDEIEDFARRSFARDEADALMALPAHQRMTGFFACWTRKEAIIKADGRGLSLPLDRFSVTADPDAPARLLSFGDAASRPENFILEDVPAPEGFRAAVALRRA